MSINLSTSKNNEKSFDVRPINSSEQKYTYTQSIQISSQTGCIGCLRGDFGSSGSDFFSSWFDKCRYLKTEEFKEELDMIINALRSKQIGLLKNRNAMKYYITKYPGSEFQGNYAKEYGFRMNTKEYTYLIRCNPVFGDYNFYCWCFVRQFFDNHIKNAEKGIRFITPNYNDKFTISDGDEILITSNSGEKTKRICRYIDDYHCEIGNSIYHICEFAEKMECNGSKVIPLRSSLPDMCYVYIRTENTIGIIKKGEIGYYKTDLYPNCNNNEKEFVKDLNTKLGVSETQSKAMEAGSMFGWDSKAADPSIYNNLNL